MKLFIDYKYELDCKNNIDYMNMLYNIKTNNIVNVVDNVRSSTSTNINTQSVTNTYRYYNTICDGVYKELRISDNTQNNK